MLVKYIKQRFEKMRRKSRKHTVENKQPRIEPIVNSDELVDISSQPFDDLEFFATEAEPVWTLESEQSLFGSEPIEKGEATEQTVVQNKQAPESQLEPEKQPSTEKVEAEQKKQYEGLPTAADITEPSKITLNKQSKASGVPRRKVDADRLKEKRALRKKQLLKNKRKIQQEQPKQKQLELDLTETAVRTSSQDQSSFRVTYQPSLEPNKPLIPEDFIGYSDDKIAAIPDEGDETGDDDEAIWPDIYLDQVAKQQVNESEFFGFPDEVYDWDESTLVDDEHDIGPIQDNILSPIDRAWQLVSKIAVASTDWTNEDSEVLVSALLKHNNHWQTQRALTRLIDEYSATSGEIGALLEMRNAWKNSQYTRVFRFGGSAVEGWPNLSWRLGLGVLRLLDTEDSDEGMLFIEDCFDDWSCSPALMKGYPCFATYLNHIINHFRRLNQEGIRLLPYADITSAWLIETSGEEITITSRMKQELENYGLLPDLPDHSLWPHVSDQLTEEDYAEAIAK